MLPRAATLIVVVSLVAGAGACTNDGGGDTSDAPGSVPACESFDRQPTGDVAEHFNADLPCGADIGLDELEPTIYFLQTRECDDGRFLYWNDAGWGWSDGTWTASSDGLPPETELTACTP